MPIHCTFTLNKKNVSTLSCPGVGEFAAFSGDRIGKNNSAYIAVPDVGPLPPGKYYIVDRGSGGFFSHLRDSARVMLNDTDKSTWFALYRDDGAIDDQTFVNKVQRDLFRLHPHGLQNLSKGCITLLDVQAYSRLRKNLLNTVRIPLPNGKGFAYGTVDVKE